MSLKYACPGCGTSLGYEGLCWKCKCEQDRQAALAWTPEQIGEKQKNLIQNIRRLAEMEDPEFTDFWQLLGYRDAIAPEIQRAALAAEVFWPCEIYYHAPADVRDGLIHALLSAEYSSEASNLMSCLAMQGDDKAMETLLELERNPRPWRKGLYVDPSSYAQIGVCPPGRLVMSELFLEILNMSDKIFEVNSRDAMVSPKFAAQLSKCSRPLDFNRSYCR